jgi:hypothetical protein
MKRTITLLRKVLVISCAGSRYPVKQEWVSITRLTLAPWCYLVPDVRFLIWLHLPLLYWRASVGLWIALLLRAAGSTSRGSHCTVLTRLCLMCLVSGREVHLAFLFPAHYVCALWTLSVRFEFSSINRGEILSHQYMHCHSLAYLMKINSESSRNLYLPSGGCMYSPPEQRAGTSCAFFIFSTV